MKRGLLADGTERHALIANQTRREYLLHAPTGAFATPRPLVVVLHGGGATAALMEDITGWSALADAVGAYVLYPEGARRDADQPATFLRNPQFWNVGFTKGYLAERGVDDVAYLRALVAHVCKERPIDRARVYLTGFSNGAAMTLLLGAVLEREIAAIAAVAGRLWPAAVKPANPPPLLYITGDADPLNPVDGGVVEAPWGHSFEQPPLRETWAQWAAWSGLPDEPTRETDADGVRALAWGGATAPRIVVRIIAGAGHVWPGGKPALAERITGPLTDRINATDASWAFFAGRRLHGDAAANHA